jgi:hypothetical protein
MKAWTALWIGVVVNCTAPRKQPQAWEWPVTTSPERVCDASFKPTHCSGTHAAEKHACLVGLQKSLVESPLSPNTKGGLGVAPADIQHVLLKYVALNVGKGNAARPRFAKECEMRGFADLR